jgi:aminoglycoside phosphotransferase (APT) family kinase protein
MLAADLLDAIRHTVGRADLDYAEPPIRLSGGYFTENYAIRVADAPAPRDGPLVVRLFPSEAPPDLARREATVQRVLVDQGYPAPGIVFFDESALLLGRHFFVMERLPGRPLMGGIRVHELIGSGWSVFRRLVEITASSQAWLHRLDAAPLVLQLGTAPAGIERWLERLESQARSEFDGLAAGLEWLVEHRPTAVSKSVICHGDLHAGNILVDGKRLTGVLDYTVATVAEPALDVGFTAMSLHVAPIDAPAPIQRVAARVARWMSDRYVAGYCRETGADLTNQPYYEALRCVSELTNVVSYRLARAQGQLHDAPRPTWDSVSDQMIKYFHARTGVTLELPPPVKSR